MLLVFNLYVKQKKLSSCLFISLFCVDEKFNVSFYTQWYTIVSQRLKKTFKKNTYDKFVNFIR